LSGISRFADFARNDKGDWFDVILTTLRGRISGAAELGGISRFADFARNDKGDWFDVILTTFRGRIS
jgi:hypothetical protein